MSERAPENDTLCARVSALERAITGSPTNGCGSAEQVNASLIGRLLTLERHVQEMRGEIHAVRAVAAQLQAAGAIVGAFVVGLQIFSLAMKLMVN